MCWQIRWRVWVTSPRWWTPPLHLPPPPRQLSLLFSNMVILLISYLVTNDVRKCCHRVIFSHHINRFHKLWSDICAHWETFLQPFGGSNPSSLYSGQTVSWHSLVRCRLYFWCFYFVSEKVKAKTLLDNSGDGKNEKRARGELVDGGSRCEQWFTTGLPLLCYGEEVEVFCNWVGCHGNRRWNTEIT